MIALQYERRPYLLVILLIIRIIINYTRILAEHYFEEDYLLRRVTRAAHMTRIM